MMPLSPVSTTALFQSVGIFSGFLLPVAVLLLFVILVLPGIGRAGVKPESLALAAYAYLAEALGVILMTAGGLPAVFAVISHQMLSTNTYMGLLVLFIVGGMIYLWHDNVLQGVDSASKAIPGAIFFFTWKFIGLVVVLFTVLSLILQLLVGPDSEAGGLWNVHLVMLLYGFLLCWFTVRPHGPRVVSRPKVAMTAKSAKTKAKKAK